MVNSIKDYNLKIIITDATTGKVIIVIPCRTITHETMSHIIEDIILEDSSEKHGFYLKYGIEP